MATYPHNHNEQQRGWAFVYWAQVPKNSGDFYYYPMGMPFGPEKTIKPKEGHFLMFPSWLLHGVRRNASNEKRISMSTNLIIGGSSL